jgi:hypothetical protein
MVRDGRPLWRVVYHPVGNVKGTLTGPAGGMRAPSITATRRSPHLLLSPSLGNLLALHSQRVVITGSGVAPTAATRTARRCLSLLTVTLCPG